MGAKDLPIAKGKDIVNCLLTHFGLKFIKRSEKNHFILSKPGSRSRFISIPDHREVKRDLLAAELRVVGIETKDFAEKFRI